MRVCSKVALAFSVLMLAVAVLGGSALRRPGGARRGGAQRPHHDQEPGRDRWQEGDLRQGPFLEAGQGQAARDLGHLRRRRQAADQERGRPLPPRRHQDREAEAVARGDQERQGLHRADDPGPRRQGKGAGRDVPHARLLPAALDRHDQGRTVRLHRQPGNALCMLPFPDDYYTRRRAEQPNRAPDRLHRPKGCRPTPWPATSKPRPTTPPTASARARRSCVKVPGIETTGRRPRDGRGRRSTTCASYTQKNAPVVVIDADHREALADLGRDRLHRHRRLARRCSRSTRRSTSTSGHRYIVAIRNLKNAAGEEARSASRLPLLPRRRPLQAGPDQRPAHALQEHLREPDEGRDVQRDNLYLAWDFTVGERPQQRRPRAGDARRRLRPARRHEPRRRRRRRAARRPSTSRASKTNRTQARSPAA